MEESIDDKLRTVVDWRTENSVRCLQWHGLQWTLPWTEGHIVSSRLESTKLLAYASLSCSSTRPLTVLNAT
jgi:hypothetical protein